MTRDTPDIPDPDISTEAEFDTALQAVLHAAIEGGFEPFGTWVYRNAETRPDLEVMVSQLAKEPTDE